jgi:hypothetical protein
MGESLLGRDGRELRERRAAKWAAGSGEYQTQNLGALAGAEALVNRVVFAIDRKEFAA